MCRQTILIHLFITDASSGEYGLPPEWNPGEHGEDEGCKVGFSAFTGSTGSAWFSLIWSWCWVTR